MTINVERAYHRLTEIDKYGKEYVITAGNRWSVRFRWYKLMCEDKLTNFLSFSNYNFRVVFKRSVLEVGPAMSFNRVDKSDISGCCYGSLVSCVVYIYNLFIVILLMYGHVPPISTVSQTVSTVIVIFPLYHAICMRLS